MESDQNTYFDEAYFQRGEERGTAYRDYARSANQSPTFKEIAAAIASVFKPRKCLEIGCATGSIVRNLNELGIDAHGIDVSDWAIRNKLHENVILAGADDLPFEDGSFDLVYSSHALEHIPMYLIDTALREIDRVSASSGYQFHMLPIVGTYPYDYDAALARSNLKADPTHNVLETLEWWLHRWTALGWRPLGVNICLFNDTGGAELSSGQFTLSRDPHEIDIGTRAFEWNKLVHRRQFRTIERSKARMTNPRAIAPSGLLTSNPIGHGSTSWCDYERAFDDPIAVDGSTVEIVVDLLNDEARPLRMALIDDSDTASRGVLEFWSEFPPGLSAIHVPIGQFRILEGSPRLDRIDRFYFGGDMKGAEFRIAGSINFPNRSISL
jgi:ubiquinone/menaquinone biosynthesis C-methylase UbiE